MNQKLVIYCMKKRIIYFWYKRFRKYPFICCGNAYGGFDVVIRENIKKSDCVFFWNWGGSIF